MGLGKTELPSFLTTTEYPVKFVELEKCSFYGIDDYPEFHGNL
jgi:hypothetical protein